MNQQIKTSVGIIIILIISITVGFFTWKAMKEGEEKNLPAANVQNEKAAQQNDETAGWQTYKNEKYGFEFKHPAELVPASETSQGLPFLRVLKNNDPAAFADNIQFGTSYTFVSKGTVEDNMNWAVKEYSCQNDEIIPLSDGNKACCYGIRYPNKQTGIGDLGPGALLVTKNNLLFFDYNIGKDNQVAEAEKTFRLILSTFKFKK